MIKNNHRKNFRVAQPFFILFHLINTATN